MSVTLMDLHSLPPNVAPEAWFAELSRGAQTLGELLDLQYVADGTSAIRFYFADPRRVEAFGGPTHPDDVKSFDTPRPVDSYANWVIPLWGRRCAYYLGALARGLIQSSEVTGDKKLGDLGARLLRQSTRLRRQFGAHHRDGDTVRRSIDRGHGIVNFHRTYLDPILFSSLCLLADINAEDWSSNGELGIATHGGRAVVRNRVLEIIAREVSLYTRSGVSKSEVLVDEATLWWGVYEVIKAHGKRFRLPGCDSLRGFRGARELVCKLAEWALNSPTYPTPEIARAEATAEIQCSWRTQMFIVQNAIDTLALSWPEDHRKVLEPTLMDVIHAMLHAARQWWDRNPVAHGHAYFVGVGLEVLSRCAKAGMFTPVPVPSPAEPYCIGPFSKQQIANALRLSIPKLNERVRQQKPRLIRRTRQEWLIDERTLEEYERRRLNEWEVQQANRKASRNPTLRQHPTVQG